MTMNLFHLFILFFVYFNDIIYVIPLLPVTLSIHEKNDDFCFIHCCCFTLVVLVIHDTVMECTNTSDSLFWKRNKKCSNRLIQFPLKHQLSILELFVPLRCNWGGLCWLCHSISAHLVGELLMSSLCNPSSRWTLGKPSHQDHYWEVDREPRGRQQGGNRYPIGSHECLFFSSLKVYCSLILESFVLYFFNMFSLSFVPILPWFVLLMFTHIFWIYG